MNFREIPQFTKAGNWECDYTLKEFINRIEEWEENEGLELNPDFQRGHIWTEEQQIRFIEFLLKGGKTGRVIYLNHPNWSSGELAKQGEFICIDGLQRTTAIKRFIHNEIKVFGYYFKEFEGNIRVLQGIKINVNNLKTRKEVLQWYLEMNEGGTPHTTEELNRVKKLLEKEK